MATENLSRGNDDGTIFGLSSTDKIGFYGLATAIVQRAGGATSLVGTASSSALDTATKAALIEVMNTLSALGIWPAQA